MDMTRGSTPSTGSKRIRDDVEDDSDVVAQQHQRKHVRSTLSNDGFGPSDSVISTPTGVLSAYEHPKYDSDAPSSMMSEPGSPQDLDMSSSGDEDDFLDPDDDMVDDASFDLLSDAGYAGVSHGPRKWRTRLNSSSRLPTPFSVPLKRSPSSSSRMRSQVQQHIRQRHPQEYSAEHRDAPSPIDEDEVSTPQSAAAADAAGSQLSMLSVSDMDMDPPLESPHVAALDPLPGLLIAPARPSSASAIITPGVGLVRKQRQRSGAQSSGSASPARSSSQLVDAHANRRGFSVGFRADCEKCRMRVPGHMNHFIS